MAASLLHYRVSSRNYCVFFLQPELIYLSCFQITNTRASFPTADADGSFVHRAQPEWYVEDGRWRPVSTAPGTVRQAFDVAAAMGGQLQSKILGETTVSFGTDAYIEDYFYLVKATYNQYLNV